MKKLLFFLFVCIGCKIFAFQKNRNKHKKDKSSILNDLEIRTFDINFDGFIDLQLSNNDKTGANSHYFVYLYNTDLKDFIYSKELSGNSFYESGIQLNKQKRIATYSKKIGGGLYWYKQIHFNKNSKIINKIIFWNEKITSKKYAFHYTKHQNSNLIKHYKTEKTIIDNGIENIYNTFNKWIKEISLK